MVTVLLGIFLVALIAVLIGALYFVDRLIRYEYQFHREAWERDGRPVGYFFRPPEISWFRGAYAGHCCAVGWLFYTPPWTRDDMTARTLLSLLRWCLLVWNVGILTFFGLVALYVHVTPRV
jgi:hypothetical protein